MSFTFRKARSRASTSEMPRRRSPVPDAMPNEHGERACPTSMVICAAQERCSRIRPWCDGRVGHASRPRPDGPQPMPESSETDSWRACVGIEWLTDPKKCPVAAGHAAVGVAPSCLGPAASPSSADRKRIACRGPHTLWSPVRDGVASPHAATGGVWSRLVATAVTSGVMPGKSRPALERAAPVARNDRPTDRLSA